MANLTWDEILRTLERMLGASVTTLELFGFTLLFALPLGLLVSFGRMSKVKPLRWAIQLYLLIMRGTPLMIQLIFFWFVLPAKSILPDSFSDQTCRLIVAIVAFSLNYAAYFAEIYRSGIEGVPSGQREAASVLGFSRGQTFFHVVLPQVVKRILPPMGNEFMTLVKDTSLAQVIAVAEMTWLAGKIQASMVSIFPVVVAAMFYLIMNAVVSKCFSVAEKRLSYYH